MKSGDISTNIGVVYTKTRKIGYITAAPFLKKLRVRSASKSSKMRDQSSFSGIVPHVVKKVADQILTNRPISETFLSNIFVAQNKY